MRYLLIMRYLPIIIAAVDLVSGIENITNQVSTQAKAIMGIIFALVSLVCLGFTVGKGIALLASYHNGHPNSPTPVILCAIGTIVAGLASSATFLGWFGV